MNFIYTLVSFLLIFSVPADSFAALNGGNQSQLKIRTGRHDGFLRIVLEGPEGLVVTGKVVKEEKKIIVRFEDSDFTVQMERTKIPCKKNNNTLAFALEKAGDMKVFSLSDPDRLVIDVYTGEHKTTAEKAVNEVILKENNRGNGSNSDAGPRRPEADSGKLQKPGIVGYRQGASISSGLSFFGREAEASTIPHPVSGQSQDNKSAEGPISGRGDEGGFIPSRYKNTWDVLKKENNPYRVIKELSAQRPGDAALLAAYHFVYGEALAASTQYLAAVEQLRLAYIHASNQELKELALLRRAEAYAKLGFYYEAKLNYSVFIKDFPASGHIARAHLGLANSLSETGSFEEAVAHYEKAGHDPEVLFNMANALQKLEKVEEARKAYGNAVRADSSYPEKSPETSFLLAENLRMTGNPADAKKLLSAIVSGPFRDSARISLGLIAMDESNVNEAIEYFQSIAFSRNMKIKVTSLFHLSLAYLKTGKMKESISTLEEIRKNYPDSSMYDEALLVLSKLYRQDGRTRESVALLKELMYGNSPPKEAFTEMEGILAETEPGAAGEAGFTDLWREVGQWMLDETRGEFLLKIAGKLKPEGKPFLKLCSWLAENASGKVKISAALELADHYSGLENAGMAEKYMTIAKDTSKGLKIKEQEDTMYRIEARINHTNKNNDLALKNLVSVKEFKNGDFRLLGSIITGLKESGANMQPAVTFYEKIINRAGGEAADYVRLADILYEQNEEKALAYYRTAHEKDPQDEWAIYRIGLIVDKIGRAHV